MGPLKPAIWARERLDGSTFVDDYVKQIYPGREQKMFEKLAETQPVGRMGKPDEVASLALFLCVLTRPR